VAVAGAVLKCAEHLDRLNHTLTLGQHSCLIKLWEDESSLENSDGATY